MTDTGSSVAGLQTDAGTWRQRISHYGGPLYHPYALRTWPGEEKLLTTRIVLV